MGRLRQESGFTLIELLVSISIGTVVVLALFTLVDVSMPAARRIDDRVDAQQRGRNGVEQALVSLRAATCVRNGQQADGTPIFLKPIGDATDPPTATKVTFYAAVTTPADPAGFAPQKRQLELSGTQLIERRWTSAGSPGAYTWVPQPTRVVAGGVGADGTNPVFSYYAYDNASPPAIAQLTPPISAADQARIVKVGLRLRALSGAGAGSADTSARFATEVAVRVPVDFTTDATTRQGPACML
jgi:prepilin-type N-terminal cleavage/methylation domain-containing protein